VRERAGSAVVSCGRSGAARAQASGHSLRFGGPNVQARWWVELERHTVEDERVDASGNRDESPERG
jgi:hypothetical protein